jgi:hypothetical protein
MVFTRCGLPALSTSMMPSNTRMRATFDCLSKRGNPGKLHRR